MGDGAWLAALNARMLRADLVSSLPTTAPISPAVLVFRHGPKGQAAAASGSKQSASAACAKQPSLQPAQARRSARLIGGSAAAVQADAEVAITLGHADGQVDPAKEEDERDVFRRSISALMPQRFFVACGAAELSNEKGGTPADIIMSAFTYERHGGLHEAMEFVYTYSGSTAKPGIGLRGNDRMVCRGIRCCGNPQVCRCRMGGDCLLVFCREVQSP